MDHFSRAVSGQSTLSQGSSRTRRFDGILFDSSAGCWLPSRQVSFEDDVDSQYHIPEKDSTPPAAGTPESSRAKGDLMRLHALLATMGMLTCLLAFLSGVAADLGSRFRKHVLEASYEMTSRMLGPGWGADGWCLVAYVSFEVVLVVAAHRIARWQPMSYGSAVPEMRCALQGTDLKSYYGMRLLWVRIGALMLCETAGLPVGKEGPFVHMAAIISNKLLRLPCFGRTVHIPAFWPQILAASVAVGSCSAFGVPIGGVLFALEVMPDSCWRNSSYWSNLWACVFASFALRTLNAVIWIHLPWPLNQTIHDPIVTLLPSVAGHSEAANTASSGDQLFFVLASAAFGALCGVLGCCYIKTQSFMSSIVRPWLLADTSSSTDDGPSMKWRSTVGKVRGILEEPLCAEERKNYANRVFDLSAVAANTKRQAVWSNWSWSPSRGAVLCGAVAALDAIINFGLPVMRRNSQPSLLWEMTSNPWVRLNLPGSNGDLVLPHDHLWSMMPGFAAALFVLVVKWLLVSLVLVLPLPSGCVIPLYVIGALIARLAMEVLDLIGCTRLLQFDGELILVFATAFTAAVCRSVSVCIVVFEIVAIPGLLLPLSAAGVVAVYVANLITPSIFEVVSRERRLPAVPQPRSLLDGMVPLSAIMRTKFPTLPRGCSGSAGVAFLRAQLEAFPDDREFPVVASTLGEVKAGVRGLPVGYMYRRALEEVCEVGTPVSVCHQEVIRDEDLLYAPQVPKTMTVKSAFDILELYSSTCICICDGDCMIGMLSYSEMLVLANEGALSCG